MKKLLVIVVAALCVVVQGAAKKPARKAAPKAVATQRPAKVKSDVRRDPYQGAISVDAASGKVLFEDRADMKCCPASVTKLMTALLVLEDLHVALRFFIIERDDVDDLLRRHFKVFGYVANAVFRTDQMGHLQLLGTAGASDFRRLFPSGMSRHLSILHFFFPLRTLAR